MVDLIDEKPTVQDSTEVEAKYGDCFHPKMENWEKCAARSTLTTYLSPIRTAAKRCSRTSRCTCPGSTVAIVGETGAGKSTLVNLVRRFFGPDGSRVLRRRDARERSQLLAAQPRGYVLQSPHLFSGTIRENIRYGKPDATDEEVYAAAKAVSADRVACSNRAMTRTWASAATSSPRAKNSSFPSPAR
ncbi:MAG: ATP-binding cassette domain-containing protein [Christensenellales bacterium]